MKVYDGNEHFIPLRQGLMDHLKARKISFQEYGVFIYILQLSGEKRNGTVLTNARHISEDTGLTIKSTKGILYRLRKKQYIYYRDTRGYRGAYLIFINKFRIRLSENRTAYTDIWDRNGEFIGEVCFFARLKVSNLISKMAQGLRLWVHSPRLSEPQVLDYVYDFREMMKRIELFTENRVVAEVLRDFDQAGFETFPETLPISPDTDKEYIQITRSDASIYPSIKTKAPGKEEIQRIADLCDGLKSINHGFDPVDFVGRTIKAEIPFEATIRILEEMERQKDSIKNGWGYAKSLLNKFYPNHNYARNLSGAGKGPAKANFNLDALR